MLGFSIGQIMANFIYSVFGFYLVKRGKSQGHIPWICIGVALMTYTYFVTSDFLCWGIGALLLGLAYRTR